MAAESILDVSRTPIPVFNGEQFSLYKMQMMAFLAYKELLEVVEAPVIGFQGSSLNTNVTAGGTDVTDAKVEDLSRDQKIKHKKSLQAYNILLMSLKPEQLQMVVDIPRGNAYGVWSALLSRYERKTIASKISIRNELHNLKMKNSEHIDVYIARLKQLVLSLADMGSRMSNDELIYILFKGLPETYQATIDTLSLKNNLEFEEACTYVRDRYERIMINEKENDVVNVVTEKERYNKKKEFEKLDKLREANKGKFHDFKCRTCNKPGHMEYYCPQNHGKKKCSYCRKLGHDKSECYFFARNQQEKEEEPDYCNYVFAVIDKKDNENVLDIELARMF